MVISRLRRIAGVSHHLPVAFLRPVRWRRAPSWPGPAFAGENAGSRV